jgi:guanylate kinase
MEQRLAMARREMEAVDQFDYVVINREDHLDDAVGQIRAIITAEKQRVRPRRVML